MNIPFPWERDTNEDVRVPTALFDQLIKLNQLSTEKLMARSQLARIMGQFNLTERDNRFHTTDSK